MCDYVSFRPIRKTCIRCLRAVNSIWQSARFRCWLTESASNVCSARHTRVWCAKITRDLGRHPRFQEFVREQHVAVSAVGGGHAHQTIERALEAILPARNIIVRVGGFTSAAVVAKDIDAIASLPTPVAKVLARELDMRLITIPVRLPSYEVSQYWHERLHREPGNQWLRVQFFREFGGTRQADSG